MWDFLFREYEIKLKISVAGPVDDNAITNIGRTPNYKNTTLTLH